MDLQLFAAAAPESAGLQPALPNGHTRLAREVGVLEGRGDPVYAQQLREAIMEEYFDEFEEAGFDGRDLIEQYTSRQPRTSRTPGFSYVELQRSLSEAAGGDTRARRTREAITTTQFATAVNLTVVHDIYQDYGTVPAVWRDLAENVPSNGEDEIYPEEWSDDMPQPIAETEPTPESRAFGGRIRIRNYEYGRALVISKRLFNRDKVGQVRRLSQNFGSKYPLAMDKAFVNSFFRTGALSNLMSRGGTIPAANIAGQTTAYTTDAGPVTPTRIENALMSSGTFVDPFNIEITVDFNTIFVDSFDRFKTMRFLNSTYTPTVVNITATDATGQLPGPWTENILRGMVNLAYSPFVKKARAPISGTGFPWGVVDSANTGMVMQVVHELEVEQELPQAGRSFDERTLRWQGLIEFGVGSRNARLRFYGN